MIKEEIGYIDNQEVLIEKKKKKRKRVFRIIRHLLSFVIGVALSIYILNYYRMYDYGAYTKGITEMNKTEFRRDKDVKIGNTYSYRLINSDYTDSMMFREIEVKPNTAYKVSCYIKTENVINKDENQISGAQIILKDTEEHSVVLSGTNDWTKVDFCFSSKNKTKVEVGFRLGGNTGKVKGKAWFDEIVFEEGAEIHDNHWNMLVCMLDELDIKTDSIETTSKLSDEDYESIIDGMKSFKTSASELSNGKLQVDYDIVKIENPIKNVTYDYNYGYYLSEKDVYNEILESFSNEEYDYVFVCFRLDDNLVSNWIGLGNMEFLGKGFSNIRITDSQYSSSSRNKFTEETFLHEFLHTLERNSDEYGYEYADLHSNEFYGYFSDYYYGLRDWYKDYMNKSIDDNEGHFIGLEKEIFYSTPAQISDFEYARVMVEYEEPDTPIKYLKSLKDQLVNIIKPTEEENKESEDNELVNRGVSI